MVKKAGAYIIASGRSDFPNQVNNALVFSGIFRGDLDHKVTKIIPSIFDKEIVPAIAQAINQQKY